MSDQNMAAQAAPVVTNDNLVLLVGKATSGKSASLMGLENPEGVLYLNCEAGKKLPFPAKFVKGPDGKVGFTITDPLQVFGAFDKAEKSDKIHTIVVDSLTYLLDMYESVHVLPSSNTMQAWGNFQQYFKKLMQHYVAKSTKNVVFTAHTLEKYNESEEILETCVPVKGALKNNGIESYFSVVIAAKKVKTSKLENYSNPLLEITAEEDALGHKYVFQTRLTKETVNERLRGPLGMWSQQETYIDNNMQLVFDRLHKYYA